MTNLNLFGRHSNHEIPHSFMSDKVMDYLQTLYPNLSDPEYYEIHKRVTALRWNPEWDNDQLALKTYSKNRQ